MFTDVAIDRDGYQSKQQQEKLLFKFSSFFPLGQSHLQVIYDTLLLPLMLITTTAKKKTLFACIDAGIRVLFAWRLRAQFTEQRTAFTRE